THQQHEGSNTFGAFQIYGDPDFRLERAAGAAGAERWREPVTLVEVAHRLEVLNSELLTGRDRAQVARDLEHLEHQWRQLAGGDFDGRTLQQIGELYLKLLDPERALARFEEAARDPKRRASQMLPERVLDAHTRRMRLELA